MQEKYLYVRYSCVQASLLIKPFRIAYRTRSALFRSPSFCMIRLRWPVTVLILRYSISAISRLVWPSATSFTQLLQ